MVLPHAVSNGDVHNDLSSTNTSALCSLACTKDIRTWSSASDWHVTLRSVPNVPRRSTYHECNLESWRVAEIGELNTYLYIFYKSIMTPWCLPGAYNYD